MDKKVLESLIEEGYSANQLAKKFNKGLTTIRYWLNKFDLKTKYKSFKEGYHKEQEVFSIGTCTSCGVELNDETAYKRTGRGAYHCYCKKCFCKLYKKTRTDYKQKAIDYKGGKCINCGYNKNPTALEFHHTDSNKKEFNPSGMHNISWEEATNELDKCILLCSNCHREEHFKTDTKKEMHKEFSNNFTSSFSDKILTGKNTGKPSCKMCDVVLTEQNLASKKHFPICKKCNSKRAMKREKDGKKRAVDYMGGCCSICGYDNCIRALEFHHTDPDKKSKDYNKRFKVWSFERQKKELEFCILVCSNCHREVHDKTVP
jgi:hypothetical protein